VYRSGTMLWLSDKHMRSYTGSWTDGKMEERGEMVYADQSVYTGWWHMGEETWAWQNGVQADRFSLHWVVGG